MVENASVLPVSLFCKEYELIVDNDFIAQEVLYHLRPPRAKTVELCLKYRQNTEEILV